MVESEDQRKLRTFLVRSSSCLRRREISWRMFWLLRGRRCSSDYTVENCEMSTRELRRVLYLSFAFSERECQRATLVSSEGSSLRSSLTLRQSLGSKFSNLCLAAKNSLSAFSTSLYPLWRVVVSEKSSAPAGPELRSLKYSFLVTCVPGQCSVHFSCVIFIRRRWQNSKPYPQSRNELQNSFLLRDCRPYRDQFSISAARFLGKALKSLISSTNSCNSTSTSNQLPSNSFCSSNASPRLIFPPIIFSSSYTSISTFLGFSRNWLIFLFSDFDSASKASILLLRQLLGYRMRSMSVFVDWTEVMVALLPCCSLRESWHHSRTTRSLRTSEEMSMAPPINSPDQRRDETM